MNSLLIFRPDFHIHILDEDKLVLFSDDSHFLLPNRIYVAIAKELSEGPKTIKDLVSGLSKMYSSDFIHAAIDNLTKKFIITSKPSTLTHEALAFWYQSSIDPEALETEQARVRVKINNFGIPRENSLEKFSNKLHDLGFSVSDDAEFSIVVLDSYLGNDLSEFISQTKSQNKSWIPLKTHGTKIWLGPIFCNDSNNCWNCLEQSIKENRRVEVDIFGSENLNRIPASQCHLSANEDVGMNICGVQLAKWFVNKNEHPLLSHILTFDLVSLEIQFHPVGLIFCEGCQKKKVVKKTKSIISKEA